jgi:hypothetical protein
MDEAFINEGAGSGGAERKSPLDEIDSRLARLKGFETDRRSEEVVQAIGAMQRILEPRLPWFDQKGIAVTYHGSLQYHDPRTLDVDIAFIAGKNLPSAEEIGVEQEINDDFSRPGVWPRADCDTNFSWPGMDAMRREVEEKAGSEYDPQDVEQDADRWGSYVLSSPVLFGSQRALLTGYQKEIRRMAAESRWLRDGIIHNLDNAIRTRLVRREANPEDSQEL